MAADPRVGWRVALSSATPRPPDPPRPPRPRRTRHRTRTGPTGTHRVGDRDRRPGHRGRAFLLLTGYWQNSWSTRPRNCPKWAGGRWCGAGRADPETRHPPGNNGWRRDSRAADPPARAGRTRRSNPCYSPTRAGGSHVLRKAQRFRYLKAVVSESAQGDARSSRLSSSACWTEANSAISRDRIRSS